MRTKKVQSKNMRKHRNKKSNKSKKCSCGLKLPFLKWGGVGQTNTNNTTDLTGKLKNLVSVSASKLGEDFNEVKTKSTDAINNVTDSTKSVINDTGNQITENTNDILNKTKGYTKTATDKTSGFFTDMFNNAKNSLHDITKSKTPTNNRGSFPSKPMSMPPKSTTSTNSLSSSSKSNQTASLSSVSSSSNKSKQKSNSNNYVENAIAKYRQSLKSSNPTSKQGGRRRSSKNSRKSKKTKRRQIYKHKGGEPLGIEKSSLAFTANPVSNMNVVSPRPDQIYGQTPYPAWRFSG